MDGSSCLLQRHLTDSLLCQPLDIVSCIHVMPVADFKLVDSLEHVHPCRFRHASVGFRGSCNIMMTSGERKSR